MATIAPNETADYGTTTVSPGHTDDRLGQVYDRVMNVRLSEAQVTWLRNRAELNGLSQGAMLRNLLDAAILDSMREPERLKLQIRAALDRDDIDEAHYLSQQLHDLEAGSTP